MVKHKSRCHNLEKYAKSTVMLTLAWDGLKALDPDRKSRAEAEYFIICFPKCLSS